MTLYNAPSGVHEIRGISGLDRPERSEDRTRRGSRNPVDFGFEPTEVERRPNPCHPIQKGHPLG